MCTSSTPTPPSNLSACEDLTLKTPAYASASVHHTTCPANLPQLYCNGGQQRTSVLGAKRYFPVSLGQCANIAYGTCQEYGMTRWRSPCWYAFNGYRSCNKDAFMKFYTGEESPLHCLHNTTAVDSFPQQHSIGRTRCCCSWDSLHQQQQPRA